MEVAVPVKEKVIKSVNISSQLLQDLQRNEHQIISYINKDGKTLAIYNTPYIQTMNLTIDRMAEYWMHFQGLLSIKYEINIFLVRYEELLKSTSDFINRVSAYLNPEIAKWESVLIQGEGKMRQYLSQQQNGVVDYKALTENTNFILQNMKDKPKLLNKLRNDRDKESDEARRVAEIETESEGSKEILANLKALKQRIDQDEVYTINTNHIESRGRFDRLISYAQDIKKVKVLMENPDLISMNEVNTHAKSVFVFFEEFSRNYQELSNIFEEFKTREICLLKIKEKWQKHVDYRYRKVSNEFVEAEREYWWSKRNGAENRKVLYETNDKSGQLNKTFKNVQENLKFLNLDINSIGLAGDIHYQSRKVSAPDHYCKDTRYSASYYEFSNIHHDFHLVSNINDKHIENPEDYKEGFKTIEYKRIMNDMDLNFQSIDLVYQENLKVVNYYENLKVEINDHFNQISYKNQELFNELSRKLVFYNEFYAKMNVKSYLINETLINTLIGMIMSRINLRLKPGLCSSKPKLFTATNLNPVDFYSMFLAILQKNKRKVKGCCGRSHIDRVHSCDDMNLEDIKLLLTEPEILVALKSPDGHEQLIKEEALIENCVYSINKIIKETVKFISFYQNLKLKCAENRATKVIAKYQTSLSTVLTRNKYVSLEENTKKFNYKI